MAQQTVECEEKHNSNGTKIGYEDKESEIGNRQKTSIDTPKRATRSRRLAKPKKEFESSPSSKKQPKDEKPILDGTTDNLTKKRVLWGCSDKSLFFDALLEYGKDFDAIQNFMSLKQKKRGDAECSLKSKDQIRHFYYRTWHKISPFIHQSSSDETRKQTIELQGVLCYGEIRKKVVAKFDEKLGHKLNELVHKGSAIVKLKGKKLVLRAPSCRAKKLQQQQTDSAYQNKSAVPEKISVELMPRNNKSWSFVQGLSQNPRIQILTRTNHSISSIINFLQHKWSQEGAEGENKTKLRVHLPPNVRLNASESPSDVQIKSIKIRSEIQHAPETNISENKFARACENISVIGTPPSDLTSISKQPILQQTDEDEDDDNDDGIHMEADDDEDGDKKLKPVHGGRDKGREEDKCNVRMDLDDVSRKLLNEGLDECSGGYMNIAKLVALLGSTEVIRLEYDWMESSTGPLTDGICPIGDDAAQQLTIISNQEKTPHILASPYLNSRTKRLLEIACTEYSATSDQKNKDPKPKEAKASSNATTNANDIFRVPDCIPLRATQASKNAEKRIMDQDLLQQMPIFQKKPEMFISRRTRRKTVPKVPIPISMQRILVPKINGSIGHQEVLIHTSNGCPSLMGFSSLNNLISLNGPPPVMSSTSSSSSLSPSKLQSISSSSVQKLPPPSMAPSKPSLITMEPSELKPSVRRIIPITLNKMINNDLSVKVTTTSCQPSSISKVITGTDVFLADKIFDDSASNDVSISHKMADITGSGEVIKNNDAVVTHKQASVEEHWLHNEELSLTSFLHDASSNPPTSNGVNLLQHIFMSESSRDSNLITKFDVDLQCLMNESSLDYASRFADIAAQLSTSSSSSGLFQTTTSSSSLTVTIPPSCQPSFVSSKLIT